MAIIANDKGGAFHLVPTGTQQAVCFGVWDLGLQKSTFNGKAKVTHKVMLAWETSENIESNDEWNGQRYRVYKKYTLSLSEKATLCKDVTSWRGKPFTDEEKKGFDLEVLIGSNCLLGIVHKENGDKVYANIGVVTSIPKGMIQINPVNTTAVPNWVAKIQFSALTEADAKAIKEEEKEIFAEPEEGIPF